MTPGAPAPHLSGQSHNLECGCASLRVTMASMLPCGSLVAMYTSFSNCMPESGAHSAVKGWRAHAVVIDSWLCGTCSCSALGVHVSLMHMVSHLAGHGRARQEVDVGQVEEDRLHGRHPTAAHIKFAHLLTHRSQMEPLTVPCLQQKVGCSADAVAGSCPPYSCSVSDEGLTWRALPCPSP